ncbi:hypothetical protein QUF64_05150 [Anaerolineales bacterium HSG6]|nr:hypothetical protein [Anaerolineales bacterium HSG6]
MVSWRAEETDIQRAVERGITLRKVGLLAYPVVVGKVWDEAIVKLAYQQKVVLVQDKKIDLQSWDQAL